MSKKFTIKIEIDPDDKTILVEDDGGNRRLLSGIALFGGKPEDGSYYLFGWGNSEAAAWAYGEGFRHAHEFVDPYYKRFFKRCAQAIARLIAPDLIASERQVDPEQLLKHLEAMEKKESNKILH